jgi:hypothetical protein
VTRNEPLDSARGPEPVEGEPGTRNPAAPVRTWRPILLWTAGILLVLGLAWFIGAVVVPVWQVRAAVVECGQQNYPAEEGYVDPLGGQASAARKLALYLRMPDAIATRKELALGIMGYCGSEATPYLIDFLRREQDVDLCLKAVLALGRTKDPRAIEPLIGALDSPTEEVRCAAALGLAWSGDERAIRALVTAMDDEVSPRVRCHAVESLRMLEVGVLSAASATSAVELCIKGLGDRDASVRSAAVYSLEHLGDPRAIPALESLALRESDEQVKEDINSTIDSIRAKSSGSGG